MPPARGSWSASLWLRELHEIMCWVAVQGDRSGEAETEYRRFREPNTSTLIVGSWSFLGLLISSPHAFSVAIIPLLCYSHSMPKRQSSKADPNQMAYRGLQSLLDKLDPGRIVGKLIT